MTARASAGQGRPVLVVAGPTASGKSALTLALAEAAGGTVINADSMQVYRGLEILTAQPDSGARARVPHKLYGVLDPSLPCSAGRWRGLALDAIAETQADGRLPIVAGGTGLYLKALTSGIAPVPDIPDGVRERVRARHADIGNAAFHEDLAARDPESAARVPATDSQRMIRAMEVLEATGKPLRDWQAAQPDGPPPGLAFRTVLLIPPREDLYAAIEARFDGMMVAGALEEAKALAERALDPGLPAMKALGVPHLIAAAQGEMPLDDAVARAKTATRNYAKRQLTWFRSQIISDLRYEEKFSESLMREIMHEIL